MNFKKLASHNFSLFVFIILTSLIPACQTTKLKSKNPNGRNDAWGYVGIGGGGAMFNQTVSPHNPNTAFVSCDMTGSFVTNNGGSSWRMFNLKNQVNFYVFDPVDSNIVYAKSIALFKSIDKGNTWSILYPAASEINGFISKGDHAEDIVVTKDSTSREVLSLAIDPTNSKKLYAAISINKVTALYISDDGGRLWRKEKDLEADVKNIFIDPASPKDNRTIYVAGKTGITQKVDGIWKDNLAPEDATSLNHFSGGYDEQQKKYIIYAISGKSYFNSREDKPAIYFTNDGGQTWENRESGLMALTLKGAGLPEWRTLAASALHPEVVYVSYNNFKISTDSICNGVAKSTDYGKTWNLVWKDISVKEKSIPSANMKSDWMNDRYGPGWGENPFSIGVSPTNPDICFAGDFGRTIKTEDGGKTWEQVNSKNKNNAGWASTGLEVTTGYTIVFDPFDKKHVFIPTTDIGLMESKDGTASWMSATKDNGVPATWVNTTYWLAFDPEVRGKAYAVMSGSHDLPRPKMFRETNVYNTPATYKGGILVTENGGKNWQPISTSIGEGAFTHILIDPTSNISARTLYTTAFGKGVYKSVDGGKTWSPKNKGIAGAEPFAWQITRRENDGVLFLIVSRRSEDGSIGNDKDGAVYKSTDGAENWVKISLPEETNGPTSMSINPAFPNQLVLSAWGRKTAGKFTPDKGGGIYLSADEGKTWVHVLKNDQHISAVTYDRRNNRYYAVGFEGSAYYSEGSGNTWHRIKGYNFKWGQRVEPDPNDAEKIFIITFGGGVWYGPSKGDLNAVEDIIKN